MAASLRYASLNVTPGEGFTIDLLDHVDGSIKTSPKLPEKAGFPLAIACLAGANVNKDAGFLIPGFGGYTVQGLDDLGSALLTFYPGPLADDGLAGLLAALGK